MTPFFLVHHALAGGDSSYVERFFADVQSTVYERLGYRGAFTGELAGAQESAPGVNGRANPEALLAPAMVALYSDAYFVDSQCLLEWSLFRERVRWHHHFTGRSSPALIGLPWSIRSRPAPAPIAESGLLAGDFGEGYAATGALRLIRTGSTTARYERLIERVGDLIVRARGDELPALSPRDAELVERSGRAWVTAPAVPVPTEQRTRRNFHGDTGRERRWRMVDPEHTRRPILRRVGAPEMDDHDD